MHVYYVDTFSRIKKFNQKIFRVNIVCTAKYINVFNDSFMFLEDY